MSIFKNSPKKIPVFLFGHFQKKYQKTTKTTIKQQKNHYHLS
uniref:Uncharacterized protein n=1 Tax=viral metagenome TaxID=1070528 RepID=A0A6C0BRR5_9ZZZZ